MLRSVSFNAPLTLSFSIAATLILCLDSLLPGQIVHNWFTANQTSGGLSTYFKMLSYVLGHANWSHLFGNLSLILVLGPMLEEKYGAKALGSMMAITAIASAAISLWIFNTGLVGASGIVFMFIVLTSFTNTKAGKIPLTTILVIALYLTKELASGLEFDNVSQLAHILGGAFGALFGLLKRS